MFFTGGDPISPVFLGNTLCVIGNFHDIGTKIIHAFEKWNKHVGVRNEVIILKVFQFYKEF